MTSNEQDDRDRRDPATNPAGSSAAGYGQQYGQQPSYGQGSGEQPSLRAAAAPVRAAALLRAAAGPVRAAAVRPATAVRPAAVPAAAVRRRPTATSPTAVRQTPAQYGGYGQQPAQYGGYQQAAQYGGYGQYGETAVPAKPAAVTIAAVLGFIFGALGVLVTLGFIFVGAVAGGAASGDFEDAIPGFSSLSGAFAGVLDRHRRPGAGLDGPDDLGLDPGAVGTQPGAADRGWVDRDLHDRAELLRQPGRRQHDRRRVIVSLLFFAAAIAIVVLLCLGARRRSSGRTGRGAACADPHVLDGPRIHPVERGPSHVRVPNASQTSSPGG